MNPPIDKRGVRNSAFGTRTPGAALLELMVACLLVTTIVTLTLQVYVFFYKLSADSERGLEHLQSLNTGLRRVRADVMRARSAVVDGTGNSLVLTLETGSIRYRFDRRQQALILEKGGRSEFVADGIDRMTFAVVPSSPIVCIRARYSGRRSGEIETAVAMRNSSGAAR